MKKVLAVLLAVMMVLSMSVMAFAATGTWYVDANEVAAEDAKTTLQTLTTKLDDEGNPVDAASYTITIPATVTIPWEGTPENLGGDAFFWSVKTQLEKGDSLDVGIVEADRTGTFTDAASLVYTLSGDVYASVGDLADDTYTVNIDVAGWETVPIAEYEALVTYEANFVDASVAP